MKNAAMLLAALTALFGPAAPPQSSAAPGEVHVVVLFDITASVALDPAADRATLSAFESGFLPLLRSTDRVRIGSIAAPPVLSAAYANDAKGLLLAAQQAFAVQAETRYGPSPVWDAVGAAIESLEREPGRRVVVLHSDGLSTGGRLWREDVVRRAAAAGVSIVIVAPPGFKADAQLRAAATRTGGSYLLGNMPNTVGRDHHEKGLRSAFSKVLDLLRVPTH